MSKKLLVVVDYQNDFVDGALGFEKATKIAPYIISLVKKCETKINQNVQKKTNLKTSLNNLEKIE